MVDIRKTLGVSLVASLAIIVLSGFVATSSRDMLLMLLGFALGLLAVCLLDALKASKPRHTPPSEN